MSIITREDLFAAAQNELKSTLTAEKLDAFFQQYLPQLTAFKVDRNYKVINRYVVDSDFEIISSLRAFTPDVMVSLYDELALSLPQITERYQQYKQEAATLRTTLSQTLALGTQINNDTLMDIRDHADRYARLIRRMQHIERDFPAGSVVFQANN